MPKKNSVLEYINLLLPVSASCGCHDEKTYINSIFLPVTDEDQFYENWGRGSENRESDTCAECLELGVLEDPLDFVFLDCEGLPNKIFAFRMTLRLIESLSRLLQEYKEERLNSEKIYLAIDAPCSCSEDFSVFRLSQGEENDFADNNWKFKKKSFVETNKVVIVGKGGVRFSCDISTKGIARKTLGTVTSRWFSSEDLANINAWLVARKEREKTPTNKVADDYERGECPDCGKKIPRNAKHGYSCTNCGHVFNKPEEDDDLFDEN